MPAALKAQIEQWRKTAQRYDTEPETNEGRKELMARAKVQGGASATSRCAAYHMFEYGSAALPARHRAGRRGGADSGGLA